MPSKTEERRKYHSEEEIMAKILTLSKFRSLLYSLARLLGDLQAVRKGRVGQRIKRRLAGRLLIAR